MRDSYNREIRYLRVSVTDRCNLRCRYCMPAEGVAPVSHDAVLRFEEIVEVVEAAVRLGVDKVRITGGEPLVRKGLVEGMRLIAAIDGIRDLGMTTNGILLADYAQPLKAAGLMRVNVSLDTLSPTRYAALTRGGDLAAVLRGIEAAEAAGLTPIKLNCVIADSPEEEDARAVGAFGAAHGYPVRYIRRMHLEAGRFYQVIGGAGGDCPQCNRLRLSSTGEVRPCLFSDLAFSVRALGAEAALRRAIASKPEAGSRCREAFHRIGG